MKNVLFLTLIVVIVASCSSEPKFELEVNIHNNSSLKNKKFVIDQRINGSVVYVDTIKINKERFLLEIPYKGPGLMNISIPESNVNEQMMAAEEGKIQVNIDGTRLHFGGTPLNDRLQAFYQGNDSVSLLFKQIDQEIEQLNQDKPLTPQSKVELQKKKDQLHEKRNQLLVENTDRIIAFIKENVDNPVGEYYFMTSYITFPIERKLQLNAFATQKLKSEFRIK